MNLNKNIKMLLLLLNRKGLNLNYIVDTKYSSEFDKIYSNHTLVKWKKIIEEKNGIKKDKWIADKLIDKGSQIDIAKKLLELKEGEDED